MLFPSGSFQNWLHKYTDAFWMLVCQFVSRTWLSNLIFVKSEESNGYSEQSTKKCNGMFYTFVHIVCMEQKSKMNPVIVACIKTENVIHKGNTNMAKMIWVLFLFFFSFISFDENFRIFSNPQWTIRIAINHTSKSQCLCYIWEQMHTQWAGGILVARCEFNARTSVKKKYKCARHFKQAKSKSQL